MLGKWIKLLVAMVFCAEAVLAEPVSVRHAEGEKEELIYSLLKLSLSKSAPDITFEQATEPMNEAQLVSEVEQQRLDIMWAGADQQKDKRLAAVRIPILKGLLGHRIFIIRDGEQHRFANVTTLAQLQQFSAGQGRFWGDTAVLQNADLPTVTTIKYANLFPMLEGQRYDYFPRAVHEPFTEIIRHANLKLAVEPGIMLVYPHAMHFYLHKDNSRLLSLIEKGMQMAIADGSYDAMFFSHPMIKDIFNQANLPARHIIHIDNPFLHQDTPVNEPQYWLDVSQL
ncbi:type 2 periplasmic-binding domain-containing protein [Salinimonas lutimaris]|uniref:diguanylate cyclase n=1 Tax=Salinimonas lutimaris TaxID=914153 RepID=UPI0010C02316|nr:diguanylate cyclase [Salinimonas lutimaris]